MPGIPDENYWFRRHEIAYLFAAPLVAGRRLLEIGCGEGYGTALLATQARAALGIDYDALTVAHAARSYPDARFARANLAALPVADRSFDVVASLQVIEHVWNHPEFLAECLRAVTADGALLLTTPNRLTFSPGLDSPVNPFHTKEFTAAELCALVRANGFDVDTIAGIHPGPRLQELDSVYGGSFVAAQLSVPPHQWPSQLRSDVTSIRAADFAVLTDQDADVDRCLDLVVLARPAGNR